MLKKFIKQKIRILIESLFTRKESRDYNRFLFHLFYQYLFKYFISKNLNHFLFFIKIHLNLFFKNLISKKFLFIKNH